MIQCRKLCINSMMDFKDAKILIINLPRNIATLYID